MTAIYVSNRQEGFCVQGTVLARSKFYGNSLSAILDGGFRLHLLERGEEYMMTMPYVHCKGLPIFIPDFRIYPLHFLVQSIDILLF